MRRFEALVVLLALSLSALYGASAVENAAGYAEAARKSYDAGYAAVAEQYADTAIIYCEAVADSWFIKAQCQDDAGLPLDEVITTLEHAFLPGNFWLAESQQSARLYLGTLYNTTGRYEDTVRLLASESDVSEERLLLLSTALYRLHQNQEARAVIEQGISLFPLSQAFPVLYFTCENPDEAGEDSLTAKLLSSVRLFNPAASDLYLLASRFADGLEKKTLLMTYMQYNPTSPQYPVEALKNGLLTFPEALRVFDFLCHDDMDYALLEELCSLVTPQYASSLYAYLDRFDGTIRFDCEGKGLYEMRCEYKYGRPLTVTADYGMDRTTDLSVSCDYGTPVSVVLPERGISFEYNRYPFIEQISFESPEAVFQLERSSYSWQAVRMVRASFSDDAFSFFIPECDATLESLTVNDLMSHASSIMCTSTDPEGCVIHMNLDSGMLRDVQYYDGAMLIGKAGCSDGKLLYRDLDMDGDGFYELCEQFAYDMPDADAALLGERLFGSLSGCFQIPRFSVLYADTDLDGFYDYEAQYAADGDEIRTWY